MKAIVFAVFNSLSLGSQPARKNQRRGNSR
jgi:hypothetical protein